MHFLLQLSLDNFFNMESTLYLHILYKNVPLSFQTLYFTFNYDNEIDMSINLSVHSSNLIYPEKCTFVCMLNTYRNSLSYVEAMISWPTNES